MVVDNDSTSAMLKDRSLKGRRITDFYHQIITLDTVQEFKDSLNRNNVDTHIYFNTEDCDKLIFKLVGSKEMLRKSKLNECIREIVYLDEIDIAKKILIGETLYNVTHDAFVDTQEGTRYMKVPKFSPFKVIGVGVGDKFTGPVKIICSDDKGKKVAFYVILSGTNKDYSEGIGNGYFYKSFSFSNPRDKYKNISITDWNLVKQGKVRIGMKQEVCRLSWGEPNHINKTTGSFGVHEQWVYYDNYLYFENGKLTAIQN